MNSYTHWLPKTEDNLTMVKALGYESIEAFLNEALPSDLPRGDFSSLPGAMNSREVERIFSQWASENSSARCFMGQGYYRTHMPEPIGRLVFENPAWYTAYTPYQPEISQGRLELLFHFQSMIVQLTGLDAANASLLDEATAAAEAMVMAKRVNKKDADIFWVDDKAFPQTIAVLKTRAKPLGIQMKVAPPSQWAINERCCGALLQYPNRDGQILNYHSVAEEIHQVGALLTVAADPLALSLLPGPGTWGADMVVGAVQRFGLPMGYGGPHAGFMAVTKKLQRQLPGRIVGKSRDRRGNSAYRLSLQTREQHIRRDKATSNICTSQNLLAVMATLYAIWHGPQGLRTIAATLAHRTSILAKALEDTGYTLVPGPRFDTITIEGLATGRSMEQLRQRAISNGIEFSWDDSKIRLSLDEELCESDWSSLADVFQIELGALPEPMEAQELQWSVSTRDRDALTDPVFSSYTNEVLFTRYVHSLAQKDLSLVHSMIPLGSCTMKLNPASTFSALGMKGFAGLHPHVRGDDAAGYRAMGESLIQWLKGVTGFDDISLQPNAGSQGEYAGLLAIRRYFDAQGEAERRVCLIPVSAHGTNPASAVMAGMDVVAVGCTPSGLIDEEDLAAKLEAHQGKVAAAMLTYPSTHGVFDPGLVNMIDQLHRAGAKVYMDGANFNALLGLYKPGDWGVDVAHLNLHKTFAIPHGGGGPGMGPIGVSSELAPYLPGDPAREEEGAVSGAHWGSASILTISLSYLMTLGRQGIEAAGVQALINANYLAKKLSEAAPILYTNKAGLVAHECILDLRPWKTDHGIEAEDVAKRLMDYGFHAPTMGWPVAGTLMIEPTESESIAELDRFAQAMAAIAAEAKSLPKPEGKERPHCPLTRAPHTTEELTGPWEHPYDRHQAVFPLEWVAQTKYWPPVSRVDNVYGDRNLVCSCEDFFTE